MSLFSRIFGKGGQKKPAAAAPADPIDAFWAWWPEGSLALAQAYDRSERPSDELIEAISEHVRAMHDGLSWETGPGRASEHHFALSAEGDAELRVLTQRWLSRAPNPSKSWEYYAARRASGADARRTLKMGGRAFDYADFRVQATPDTTHAVIDVVVFHPLFADMDEDERIQPAFLFLDDVLGEDTVSSWLGTVDMTSESSAANDTVGALVEAVRMLRDGWSDEAVSLIEGQRDERPLIALMRLGLKRLDHLLHDHHLELVLAIRELTEAGFPSADEGDELNDFEDGLVEELGPRAVWIGHETCQGKRSIHFHADSSPGVQQAVLTYCQAHAHWETELSVRHDPGWEIVKRY